MELDFKKMNGLIPAIIQDDYTSAAPRTAFGLKEKRAGTSCK